MSSITLHVGQAVPWPAAPDGVGQIEYLHRRRVSLRYLRRGRLCRARPRAAELARLLDEQPLLIVQDNWLGRGGVPRRKTFEFQPKEVADGHDLRKV
jgi:hypothetical protein